MRLFPLLALLATSSALAGPPINCDLVEIPEQIAGPDEGYYEVVSGDALIRIANRHDVPWEALMLRNEPYLKVMYECVCDRPAARRRTRPYFCNDGRSKPYANTLMPGYELIIPDVEAPPEIVEAVRNIDGDRVVIVIDDTGSMNDDRQQVGAWYTGAIESSGKEITRVVLYADGSVRDYSTEAVNFTTSGGTENTCAGLNHAITFSPDAIVLVTDEPGDDWRACRYNRLPPVVVHSLGGFREVQLEDLARRTGGEFVQGF